MLSKAFAFLCLKRKAETYLLVFQEIFILLMTTQAPNDVTGNPPRGPVRLITCD